MTLKPVAPSLFISVFLVSCFMMFQGDGAFVVGPVERGQKIVATFDKCATIDLAEGDGYFQLNLMPHMYPASLMRERLHVMKDIHGLGVLGMIRFSSTGKKSKLLHCTDPNH